MPTGCQTWVLGARNMNISKIKYIPTLICLWLGEGAFIYKVISQKYMYNFKFRIKEHNKSMSEYNKGNLPPVWENSLKTSLRR